MKRWTHVLLFAVMLAATTAACGTPPPPLPGWVAPKVVTADLSSSTITAGDTFTVSGSASDDQAVTRLELHFVKRNQRMVVPCINTPWESAALVSIEYSCTMPAIAPNGNWTVSFIVGDDRFGFGPEGLCYCAGKTLQFTVAGGTEDVAGPHLDSATVSPNPATVGTPLIVTVRASDEHPTSRPQPLYTNVNGNPTHICTQTADVAITPTQHEYTFSCPPETAPGDYEGFVTLTDEMGFPTYGGFEYQIVAPTP